MGDSIYLQTERLIIRDHILEDLKSHHLLLSDMKAMYYLNNIQTKSLEESKRNLIESIEEILSKNRVKYFFRIENNKTKEHIGEIGYTVTSNTPLGKLVDLGYFTYQRHWNKGYVSEAVREVIRFAFQEDGVIRISAGCIKGNRGSERVMQKCGMLKEADFKKHSWHDNELKDRVVYRLLKTEWT